MLGTLIKYDLKFGRKTFFIMALVMIGYAILFKIGGNLFPSGSFIKSLGLSLISILSTIVFCITMVNIFKNFKMTMFSKQGYLTLTLPVKKSNLILSKMITTLIWTNFIGVAFVIMMTILFGFGEYSGIFKTTLSSVNSTDYLYMFFTWIYLNISFAFAVISIYSCMTFSKIAIGNVNMKGFFTVLYVIVFFALQGFVSFKLETYFPLSLQLTQSVDSSTIAFSTQAMYSHMDVLQFIKITPLFVQLAFSSVAFYATVYFLEKRIELK